MKLIFSLIVAMSTLFNDGANANAAANAEQAPLWPVSPQEKAIIQALSQSIEASVRAEFQKHGKAVRDAHAKHHGCVLADFTIAKDLDKKDLNYGIFKNAGHKYEAVIRYSNGSGQAISDDREIGARGMAIKVMGITNDGPRMLDDEAQTQDFPMINHPVFFVKDTPDYVQFFQDPKAFFATHPEEFKVTRDMANGALYPVMNPLESVYFSMTPRQFGTGPKIRPIKYSAAPVACDEGAKLPAPIKIQDSPDALRLAMKENLNSQPACFDFRVQRQTNEEEMPINNPVKLWSEEKSPFVTVAKIKVLTQDFDNPKREQICEDLSITPWHSGTEIQPVGSVEAARRDIYQAISKLRHELNGRPRKEPKGFADF